MTRSRHCIFKGYFKVGTLMYTGSEEGLLDRRCHIYSANLLSGKKKCLKQSSISISAFLNALMCPEKKQTRKQCDVFCLYLWNYIYSYHTLYYLSIYIDDYTKPSIFAAWNEHSDLQSWQDSLRNLRGTGFAAVAARWMTSTEVALYK